MDIGKGILSIISSVETNPDQFKFIPGHEVNSPKEAAPPKNDLGLAINECLDFCDLTLDTLSAEVKEVSQTHKDQSGNPFPVVDLGPTTLHSYCRPGSTRQIRKYPLEVVLEILRLIMEYKSTGHHKWFTIKEVQEYFLELTDPNGDYRLTPEIIESVTDISKNVIERYLRGCYKVNYDKMIDIQEKISRYLNDKIEAQNG